MQRTVLLPKSLVAGLFFLYGLIGQQEISLAQVYVLQGEKGDKGDAGNKRRWLSYRLDQQKCPRRHRDRFSCAGTASTVTVSKGDKGNRGERVKQAPQDRRAPQDRQAPQSRQAPQDRQVR